MDLYAYSQIKDLEKLLIDNDIKIERLRGLRLMKDEERISEEEIEELIKNAKEDESKIRINTSMFNSYVGKDVLYVHARQGGGNREDYPIDTTHPMYLSDCDDWYDSTYCDIYYDLTKTLIKG